MARVVKLFPFLIVAIAVSASCNNHSALEKNARAPVKATPHSVSAPTNKFLSVYGDSLRVAVNDGFIVIPKGQIANPDSAYLGIYNIEAGAVNQTFSKLVDNKLFFTLQDNVGTGYRGYLYAFDLKQKKFITGSPARNNYVYSTGGIFFLDRNHIFSVGKPNHVTPEDPFTTATGIYKIVNDRFRYLRYIDVNGEMTDDDTSIVKLYHIVTKHLQVTALAFHPKLSLALRIQTCNLIP